MSSNTNITEYDYSAGPQGNTAEGTSYSVNVSIEVQAGSDFTDSSAWTLHDALLTALQSVGWPVVAGDISITKLVLDDTQYSSNTSAKTFS